MVEFVLLSSGFHNKNTIDYGLNNNFFFLVAHSSAPLFPHLQNVYKNAIAH